MWELLGKNLGEFTIGWFILNVICGGIFGIYFKYLIDTRLTSSFKEKARIKSEMNRWLYPLLLAANDLEHRIDTILTKGINQNWLHTDVIEKVKNGKGFLENPDREEGYFYLSTLYTFANYFGCIEIFKQNVGYLEQFNKKKYRNFIDILTRIVDIFRERSLFNKIEYSDFHWAKLYRHYQTGLGELMIKKNEGDKECLSFREFVEKYQNKSDNAFRFWLKNIDGYIIGLTNNDNTRNEVDYPPQIKAKIIRLSAIQYWLIQLIQFIDPRGDKIKTRDISHINKILNRLPEEYKLIITNHKFTKKSHITSRSTRPL